MLSKLPLNLLYTILVFLLTGFANDIQLQLYPTLPVVMENIINSTLIRYNMVPNSMRISLVTSLMNTVSNVGIFLSIAYFLPLADKKGPKFVSVYIRALCGVLASIFYLGCAFFESVEFYLIAEILCGTTLPLRFFTTSVFISESSPDQFRGLATFALMIGDSVVSMTMFSLTSPNIFGNPDTWYIFPMTSLIIFVTGFCLMLRIHESPKWLVRQNRIAEAEASIRFFQQCSDEDEVMDSIIREKNMTIANNLSLKAVWMDDTLREGLIIVVLVSSFSWMSPNAVESLYSSTLHGEVGYTVNETLTFSLLYSIIFLPFSILGTLLIDKIGRRRLMFLIGIIMIAKSYLMISILTVSKIFGASNITKYSMIFADVLSNLQHSLGLTSIGPLLISELFPQAAKTAVGQLVMMIGNFAYIPIIAIFPIIDSIFTAAFYLPLLFVQPIILYFILKKLPETNQRAVCNIIETLDHVIASRRTTMMSEKMPLLRDRAITLNVRRDSELMKQRKRSRTMTYEPHYK